MAAKKKSEQSDRPVAPDTLNALKDLMLALSSGSADGISRAYANAQKCFSSMADAGGLTPFMLWGDKERFLACIQVSMSVYDDREAVPALAVGLRRMADALERRVGLQVGSSNTGGTSSEEIATSIDGAIAEKKGN